MIFSLEQDFSFPGNGKSDCPPTCAKVMPVVPTKVMVKVVAIPLASG